MTRTHLPISLVPHPWWNPDNQQPDAYWYSFVLLTKGVPEDGLGNRLHRVAWEIPLFLPPPPE